MTPNSDSKRPRRLIFIIFSFSLLFLVLLFLGLIFARVFDPKPLGELTFRDELDRRISVDDKYQESLFQLSSSRPFSFRLGASWRAGNPDIGYGLKLGDVNQSVVIAVSPLGYVTIMGQIEDDMAPGDRGVATEDRVHILPWQTWPHVSKTTEGNEIWVDVEDSKLTSVRINRELLWTGSLELERINIEFWAQSFGEPGIVNLDYIELYQNG